MNLLGSITELRPEHFGQPVLTGSHGGRVTSLLAAAHGVSGLVCHDAGIGLDEAGIAALGLLESQGAPAAAVDHRSARIGDPHDMLRHGIISRVNRPAGMMGIEAGMAAQAALRILGRRPPVERGLRSAAVPDDIFKRDTCCVRDGHGRERYVVLLDSAASIGPQDEGQFVVTGSHGGLPGNSGARAIKAAVRLAVFNDAGIGKDAAGTRRLPELDRLGIAGMCVASASARIGEAQSTWETGIITVCNLAAQALGIQPGERVRDLSRVME